MCRLRLKTRCVDRKAKAIGEALAIVEAGEAHGQVGLVGRLGNAADTFAEFVKCGIAPGCVTDHTSAHDPINSYLPQSLTVEQRREVRKVARGAIIKPAM
ncbi:urocanate hydratase [Paraburkholderia sp. WC7.3d]